MLSHLRTVFPNRIVQAASSRQVSSRALGWRRCAMWAMTLGTRFVAPCLGIPADTAGIFTVCQWVGFRGSLQKSLVFFQQMWGVPVDFPLNQWDALSKTATIAAMEDWPTCNPFDLFASPHRSCEIQSGVNQWDSGLSCAPFSLRLDPLHLLWVYHGLFHSWSNPCVFLQVKVQIMPVWMQIQPNPKGDLTQTNSISI